MSKMKADTKKTKAELIRELERVRRRNQELEDIHKRENKALGDLSFGDIFNVDEIQAMQDSFAAAANVASIITDPGGRPLTRPSNFCRLCRDVIRSTEKGLANCMRSDAELGRPHPDGPIIRKCLSAGLLDAGTSIFVGSRHIANWLIGQVRDETDDQERMIAYAREIGIREETFLSALEEVPVMAEAQFRSAAGALFQIAHQMSMMALQNVQQGIDILALREAGRELKKHRDHLEELVTKRTTEIEQRNNDLQNEISERTRVEKKRKELITELERTNNELNDFAYIVSHDLKAPLRGISSLADWLAEDHAEALAPRGREYIEKLRVRTRRMNDFVDGVLQYSRLGRMEPEPSRLDCNAVVREVIATLSPPESIPVTIEGELPTVVYDKMFLSQLFRHLIGNAVIHMGKPNGNVIVSCTHREEHWEFCIKDDGVGIPEKHFRRIFKIFQTLKPRSEVESTGIGLPLVRKIAARYGGTVWVASTVGKGSSFYFTIPRVGNEVME